jgi:hypothetical protein
MSFRFRIEDRSGRLPKISKRIWEWQDTQSLCVRLFGVAHVHPAGSVSMAALQLAQASLPPGPPRANEPAIGESW